MSKRKSKENIHERIIRTAFETFAAQGYARTTTRNLAAAAGVTEVTLFRHFGTKEKLFTEVVEHYGGSSLAGEFEAELKGDYRSDLQIMGQHFIKIVMERSKIMRLIFCEIQHFPELGPTLALNPRHFRAMLSRYLTQQMERGVVRQINTEAAAQAFWGMILAYSQTIDLFNEKIPGDLTPEEVVNHFIDIFIEGTIRKE